MSITPLTLTGVSPFSSDLQTILDRAVQIAQIPIKQLQNKESELLQQKTLLGTFSADAAPTSPPPMTIMDFIGLRIV